MHGKRTSTHLEGVQRFQQGFVACTDGFEALLTSEILSQPRHPNLTLKKGVNVQKCTAKRVNRWSESSNLSAEIGLLLKFFDRPRELLLNVWAGRQDLCMDGVEYRRTGVRQAKESESVHLNLLYSRPNIQQSLGHQLEAWDRRKVE